jgi:hypothetical protein
MAKVYRITPLEKKSICWHIEMFRRNDDDSISWFNVDDHYRWGQGFVEEDLDCNLPWEGDRQAHALTSVGWGAELDDQHACWFEFSDDVTEEEQEEIKRCYLEGDGDPEFERMGSGWIFEGDHAWELEDEYLVIDAPYKVDLCDENTCEIIQENVKLRNREEYLADLKKNTEWPFPTEEPK